MEFTLIHFIGIIHFIHAPLLVFVFVFDHVNKVVYMNYFFGIMFLYTWLNGECPISYMCKKMIDSNYSAGQNITYYPEMAFIPEPYIHFYFGITTTIYLLSLANVVYHTTNYILLCLMLFVYFLFTRNQECWAFFYFQEFTKWILFFYFSRYLI